MKKISLILMLLAINVTINAQQIALTFDDAPKKDGYYFTGLQRTETLIHKLKQLDIPQVAFFCISSNLDSIGRLRLEMYDNAGHVIANHTHTHQWYTDIGIDNYITDFKRADTLLHKFKNFRKWFRYPFLDEGRTKEDRDKLRAALISENYFNGYVTVDDYDWYIDNQFQNALKNGEKVDLEKLGEFYIDHIYQHILFYDNMSKVNLGRSVKHVLLLHENDLAALFIDDLVSFLRKKNCQIISPEEAYKDEIALIVPDVLFNNQGRIAAIVNSLGMEPETLVNKSESIENLNNRMKQLKIFEE